VNTEIVCPASRFWVSPLFAWKAKTLRKEKYQAGKTGQKRMEKVAITGKGRKSLEAG